MSDEIGTASIGLAVDSSGVDTGLNRMDATVERVGRSLSSLGQRGAAAVNNIGSGASEAANNVDRATQRQVRSIQTLTAELQSGGRATREFQETIARNRGGEAAVQALRPYLDQLEHVRTAQQEAAQAALRGGQAFNTQSQSAAQLAANLRVVPAQLTDIVTSLQGGQAPLTVFLQQGGQLRDMFGSAGGAARALGGYLVSLISPLTVAAAAVALVAVAYNQGSKEADAFRLSIIGTGNAAGVTTGQLAGMAKEASNVAGTQGANAEALAQLVGTGKVAADQLLAASITAVQSQKYLGIAVEDTVKAFADLGKDPLQATLKLNEQYNYLTLATYKQIKALTDQGRTSDAAKVAQTAYADAMASKNKQVAESLGTLEKGWNATGTAAKKAWDFMLNVGREDTIDDKIKRAQEALKAAQLARFSFIGTQGERDGAVDDKQREVDRLLNIKKVGDLTAQYAAEDAKSRDAAIEFDKQGEQYLSRRAKMEKEIIAARTLGKQAAQRGEDPAKVEENIQARIAQIKQAYAATENEGIEARIAAINRLGAIQEEQAKRALLVIQGGQEAGQNKALDQQAAYIKAVSDADEKALAAEKSRLQQRLALTAQEVTTEDGRAAQKIKLADLSAEIALKDQQIDTRRATREKDLFVLDVTNNHAIAESYNTIFDARQADLDSLDQQLQAQKDQNAAIGLNAKQLEVLNTSLVEERANRLEGKAAILDTILGREEEAEVLRKTAARIREVNAAQIEGARKVADVNAYKSFWESIDKAAQDAFTHIGEGGKSVFDRLKDSLKSGLLDLLYQFTVKQFIINVKANVSSDGFGALAGALGGSGGAAGGSALGGAANLYSIGKSIYNGFSTGFTGLASTIGTNLVSAGSFAGSSGLQAFGAGFGSGGTVGAADAAGLYTAAGGTGSTTAVTAGAYSGAAVTAAAGIAAGVLGGNLISGGYSAFGGSGHSAVNTGTAVGAAVGSIIPVVGTALGALIGGLIGGAANRLFGYKAPEITGQGIRGTLTDTSVTGQSYTDILKKGGLFRSDKRSTETADLTSDFKNSLLSGFTSIKAVTAEFGKNLQLDVKSLSDYTKQFDIKLDPKGDSGKNTQAITDFFTTVSDELATKLIPNIADFAKVGEKAGTTLERLSADFDATNSIATLLGKTATEAFGAAGLSSIAAREQFINLSGGIEALSSKLSSYSQNYLTQAEQQKPLMESLAKAFGDLNFKVPTTRDGFKDLVNGLDLTDASQVKTFNSLMALQEAFAAVTPQIDKVAQLQQQRELDIKLMEALGNSEGALAATRKDALKALLSDQARITQAQIYAAQDAKTAYDALVKVADGALNGLTAAINAEKDSINKAYNAQAESIKKASDAAVENAQKSLTAAQTQVSALKTVFSAIDSALANTKSQTDAAQLARRQAAQQVLFANAADPTKLTDNKALDAAINTVSDQSNTRLFGTFEEFARDQARTNNALATLRAAAGDQIDNAQKTVDLLTEQIDTIKKTSDQQLEQLKKDTQDQIDKLDNQLELQKQGLDLLKGINSSVLSVKDALGAFAAAIAALGANKTAIDNTITAGNGTTGSSNADKINGLYESVLGREGETQGIAFWVAQLNNGASLEKIRQDFLESDEYKNKKLRGFAVGTNRVLFDTPAYIHADERIMPAADNRQLMALMARATDPAQNNAVLSEEIRRQNTLIEEQNRLLANINASTGTAADVLEGAAKGGRPIAMTEG